MRDELERWAEVGQRRTLKVSANMLKINPVDFWSPNGMYTQSLHKMIR